MMLRIFRNFSLVLFLIVLLSYSKDVAAANETQEEPASTYVTDEAVIKEVVARMEQLHQAMEANQVELNEIKKLLQVQRQPLERQPYSQAGNVSENSQIELMPPNFEAQTDAPPKISARIQQLEIPADIKSKNGEPTVNAETEPETEPEIEPETEPETEMPEIPEIPEEPPLPTSCAEAAAESDAKTGIYEIFLASSELPAFNVTCLKPNPSETAWTLIQRRQDGSVDFDLDWQAYKQGFGSLVGEFFIGLEKLHAMTKAQKHELWIQLEDFNGKRSQAKYKLFVIGDESSQYALNALGAFDGDAGNSLGYHHGLKFSTKDVDNDEFDGENLALVFGGAWWYGSFRYSNLNGIYGPKWQRKSISWLDFHKLDTFKYVHMAIRPLK